MAKHAALQSERSKNVRTSRRTVTFKRPFSVSGIDEVQPTGNYSVDTEEERLPGVSFPAYRRVATLIHLRSRPGHAIMEQLAEIDPLELRAAQERDADMTSAAILRNDLSKADADET